MTTIYLSVKPDSSSIQQFFTTVLISQIFNFDLIQMSMCGALGTLSSIASNMISLSLMPQVIKTRDVSCINLPLAIISCINLGIWCIYAIIVGDPFMTVSQFLGFWFNFIQIMFYFWAKQVITHKDTPFTWFFMKHIIAFFSMFKTQQAAKELQRLFWADENNEFAQAHINQYTEKIKELQNKYEDQELSYEEHMAARSIINSDLRSISEKYSKAGSSMGGKSEATTNDRTQPKAN